MKTDDLVAMLSANVEPVGGGLVGRPAFDLRGGELAALVVVEAELIEILSAARQHHHAGPARHRSGAGGEESDRNQTEGFFQHAILIQGAWVKLFAIRRGIP